MRMSAKFGFRILGERLPPLEGCIPTTGSGAVEDCATKLLFRDDVRLIVVAAADVAVADVAAAGAVAVVAGTVVAPCVFCRPAILAPVDPPVRRSDNLATSASSTSDSLDESK